MFIYWILFIIPSYLAIQNLKSNIKNKWSFLIFIFFIFLCLIIGLRHETGGDWPQYFAMIQIYENGINNSDIGFQDPAFIFLNKLSAWSGGGIYTLNLICAIIFSCGLIIFCKHQSNFWLSIVVAVPYLITVVAIGYTRQGVAIGIAMVAMVALGNGKTFEFMLWIAVSALFHKSAILLIPLAILASSRRRFFTLFWVAFAGIILFFLLLQEASSFLVSGYIDAAYQSSGAAIRITMNAFPAFIFLYFNKYFDMTVKERKFWKCMSWCALLFIPLLIISPSSTAVDRVALYWIPLQLIVLSRLPTTFNKLRFNKSTLTLLVIFYSALIHFVWLNYADTSSGWIPYQFLPWIWLWDF
jgi:hypothetical protein